MDYRSHIIYMVFFRWCNRSEIFLFLQLTHQFGAKKAEEWRKGEEPQRKNIQRKYSENWI